MIKSILLAAALALSATTAASVARSSRRKNTWELGRVEDIVDIYDVSKTSFHSSTRETARRKEKANTVTVVRPDAITYYADKGCKLVSREWSPPYGNGVVNFARLLPLQYRHADCRDGDEERSFVRQG